MKTILILSVFLVFGQSYSLEWLSEHKKELGIAAGAAASGYALYQLYQKFQALNQQILRLQHDIREVHNDKAQLEADLRERAKLIPAPIDHLYDENLRLKLTIKKLVTLQWLRLIILAKLKRNLQLLQQPSEVAASVPRQPIAASSGPAMSAERKEAEEAVKAASASSEVDSFVELASEDTESSIRQIQEFIDHVRQLQAQNGSKKLEWYHYLLDNYKVIKTKILRIKNELANKSDESSVITLEKVINFDLEITTLESNSPWVKGEYILKKLISLSGQEYQEYINVIKQDQNRHITAIINLIWYFYALAAKQGKAFEQGTFCLRHHKEIVYNFLYSYANKYSRSYIDAYVRLPISLSSHLKQYKNMEQYGIDIPYEKRSEVILPKCMTHILFGQIPNGNLFIKPEDHGIADRRDLAAHAVSYVEAQCRKVFGAGDEQRGMQKERVPTEIIKAWEIFFEECNFAQKPEAAIILGKKMGIAQMVDIIEHGDLFTWQSESAARIAAKAKFMALLESYDNLESRIGNEVILAQVDFAGIS